MNRLRVVSADAIPIEAVAASVSAICTVPLAMAGPAFPVEVLRARMRMTAALGSGASLHRAELAALVIALRTLGARRPCVRLAALARAVALSSIATPPTDSTSRARQTTLAVMSVVALLELRGERAGALA